ncbi:MAG: DUF3310 domain-containing protein [Candidatus Cloacimonetes bacterium]|nr:DUF3310 domain-containing protein [Candidatus Cloacimonadota bacterium]
MRHIELATAFAQGKSLSAEDISAAVACNVLFNDTALGNYSLTEYGRTILQDGVRARLYEDAQDEINRRARSALDTQVAGNHYRNFAIQPVEFIEKNGIPFLEGSVIKRMCRHGNKAKAEDLRKAIHEITLLLELRYGEKP